MKKCKAGYTHFYKEKNCNGTTVNELFAVKTSVCQPNAHFLFPRNYQKYKKDKFILTYANFIWSKESNKKDIN